MTWHYVWSFRSAVPGAQELAEAIVHNPSIQKLNQTVWVFSIIEISHLILLTILGGAALVLALRVFGLLLPEVSARDIERLTRPWLWIGTIGGILTGIFMSIATALTLVANGAFFIKIVGLVAAILFSLALGRALRDPEQRLSGSGLALGAVGLLFTLIAVGLFVSTHALVKGAWLLAFLAAGFGVTLAVQRVRFAGEGAYVTFTRLLALGSLLSWIIVGVGGRWIGFT